MKKLLLIFCFVFSLLFPFSNVNAADKSYTIDKLSINAKIAQNGDVNVVEEITYNFQGNYNGIYRNLLKKGTKKYTITNVAVRDKNNIVTILSLTNDSQNNSYQIIDSGDKTQIKLFTKSDSEIKTFVFNYTIHDAAEKYSNYGVLNWNFYSVENNNNIKNVNLNLSLVSENFNVNKLKYQCFVDGGKFSTSNDEKNINIQGSNLTSILGVRVLFQPDYLMNPANNHENTNYTDIDNSNTQSDILRDKEHNTLLKKELIIIYIVTLTIFSIFGFYIINKRNKFKTALEKYRKNFLFFNGDMIDSAPSDLPPAFVNLLCFQKDISFSTIPATLFYLCKHGFYTLEKNTDRKHEDIIFLRTQKKHNIYSEDLSYFLRWFSAYEKNGKLSLKYLEKILKKSETVSSFKNQYDYWKTQVKNETDSLGFYTLIEGKRVLSNDAFNEQIKWNAYKKYIINYLESNTHSETLIDIDEILIYGLAFNLNMIKFEKLFKKIEDSSYYSDDFYFYNIYTNYSTFFIFDSIDSSINYPKNNLSDNSSSDSNNFGGFSDGGGFSGGGGGDSGAF